MVYSTKVLKFNRFGMKQERNLLLTTEKIANIKKKEFQRKINIKNIRALSRSTVLKDMDFVVHVDNEYDYRFICEDREKLFVQIKAVFFTKMNKNLPIYDVPDGLNKYATSKICKTRTLPPLPLPDLDETEEMEVTGENGQKESPL